MKLKRIRYKKDNTGNEVTDLFYSYNNAYYASVYLGESAVMWTIYDSFEDIPVKVGTEDSVLDAKRAVRKALIEFKCLIGKEIKKGIVLDKNNKLVVK